MSVKKFVKKPLAIAALMLACGGVANVAHAHVITNSQDVSATKVVKQSDTFYAELLPSSDDIPAGKTQGPVIAFTLSMGDSVGHEMWGFAPTGDSGGVTSPSGGVYMVDANDKANKVLLLAPTMSWENPTHCYVNPIKKMATSYKANFVIPANTDVRAGSYVLTGRAVTFES
ncbi:MyfA/PsaA family fimbrial adhesin [Yersinia enterocolitica]|uniref:MyfA/PsaA family fimbrial adhesin n=1 Tax=Yersinia enterocolitica TaxID=630 RepID=UPI0032FE3093|nr:MyfA/PsaA family fimbrial adhesin [Yersinia enterocolitica]HDL7505269.1 MyfA/PsaA family fimbrial adhesin [Yersinia enterocolitica]HDM8081581.1 MyfA/PsaA family fimbrial adhesin [Yersinia enterocolitica]